MTKLILSINTRNKSYNLLEEVYKDFGVIFHPKTPVIEVKNFIKEKANGKSTSEASSQVRQGNSERKGLVGKAKEVEEQKEANGLENPRDKIPSSHTLERKDR